MSGKVGRPRADAVRSRKAILDAALTVLGTRPDASMEQIAEAAGVTRQTVYAHFPSRDALGAAVLDRLTEEALAAMAAADLDSGPAAGALGRLLDASWRVFARYPMLLNGFVSESGKEDSRERHSPVDEQLAALIARGRESGEFDGKFSEDWLIAALIGLGHAAGAEVGAGRMTMDEAQKALQHSALRLLGAEGRETEKATKPR